MPQQVSCRGMYSIMIEFFNGKLEQAGISLYLDYELINFGEVDL